MRKLVVLATVLLWMAPAVAEDGGPSWYAVHVVVFERQAGDTGGELWSEPGAPSVGGARGLVPEGPDLPSGRVPYRELGAGERILDDVVRRLERSGDYAPILSKAWVQPAVAPADARPVRLTGGEEWPPPADGTAPPGVQPAVLDGDIVDPQLSGYGPVAQLDGIVRLARSRFLHIEADLIYRRPDSDQRRRSAAGDDGDLVTVRLHEQRRVRSGELHYLDHPLFGVLVRIDPYEPDGG